jgi:ligand-binding sensor domain-containing protein
MKALYSDGGHPDLQKMAGYTRTELDETRGPLQVKTFEELHAQAVALADDLAEEMVTAAKIKKLGDEIKLYKPMVGTPQEQINASSLLREDSVAHMRELRKAITGLDLRVPNLQEELPELVAAYRKARQIIDAGHGPKENKPA